MQDYKTGHLIGVAPWNQFRGQLLGSLVGIPLTVLGYTMYQSAHKIPGPQFPAPTAAIWLNLARLINKGELPPRVGYFMAAFALFFIAAAPVRMFAKHAQSPELAQRSTAVQLAAHAAALLPSGVAFSVGVLNTPNFSLARLTGGLLAYTYTRRRGTHANGALGSVLIIVVASGFVLGEGAASIAGLFMTQQGVQPLTCFGCRYGCTGRCAV